MRLILLLFLFLSLPLTGDAQEAPDPAKQLTQYMLDNWTTDDQLPTNTLLHLYQTREGYLWISSYDGLTRFDGLNFTVFNPENTPAFKGNTFTQMEQDRDGTLWIGSYGSGLIAYREGKFKTYPFDPLIKSLCIDKKERDLWIGTSSQGVFRFNGEDFRPALFRPLRGVTILDFEQDKKHNTWIATAGNGLVRHQNGEYIQLTTADGLLGNTVSALLADRNGKLWVGSNGGLQVLDQNGFRTFASLKGFVINRVLEDAAGTIWVSTWDGLFRKLPNSDNFEVLDETNGLTHANTTDLFAGRSGDLWIGTYWAGLFRLSDGQFLNYTPQEGLGKAIPLSVCAYGDGRYLIGTDQGNLFQVRNNRVSPFPLKTKLPKALRHLFTDSKGNLWIGHYNGVLKRTPQGREVLFRSGENFPSGMVRQILEAQDGTIWIASMGGLVSIETDGKQRVWGVQDGLSSEQVMAIAQHNDGSIWVGTNGEGLNYLNPETGKVNVFRKADGLASNLVLNLHSTPEGVLWVACNGGLTRYQNGKFFTFNAQNGLPVTTPFDFIIDKIDYAWIPTNRGVLRVSLRVLEEVATGQIKQLHSIRLFNRQDGMARSEYAGPNKAFRDEKGRLWFPTIGGVAMIDPTKISRNTKPLPVYINKLSVDGKERRLSGKSLRLPAGSQRFAFHYTALSLEAPLKTRFRCRLMPFEEEWVDMGANRTAVYTNLPHGEHIFEVSAANSDGIWSAKTATLRFEVAPYFYQTYWFWAVLVLVSLLLLAGVYRWRSFQIRERNRFLERQVKRRTAELEEKNFQIEKKNRSIMSSLQYAQRIQRAVMPDPERISELLPQAFVWLQPRDIVSGDFYWVTEKDGRIIFTAADCTGHGVPGAFMSVLGIESLEDIVNKRGITEAGKILDALHESVQKALQQGVQRVEDGMDMAVCSIDPTVGRLEFAGAKNPLIWVEDGEVHELKGDRMAIGGFKHGKSRSVFKTHYVPLFSPKGTPSRFYMFSDGFQDQFGGPEGRKFMKARLKRLLEEIHQESPKEQQKRLQRAFKDWKGDLNQTDDVLLVGF